MTDDIRQTAIELYDLYTHEGMDRRAFMTELTRIAGGTAAASALLAGIAASPAAAQMVPENDGRIVARTTSLPGAGGTAINGYAASPRNPEGPRPSVMVVHENRGLNDHIRDVTRRLAIAGYHGFAPDFLTRSGGTPADQDAARQAIGRLDLAEATADGVALLAALRGREGGNGRVGAVGFCWGGAMVNRLAVNAGSRLDAGVVFYGTAPSGAEAAKVEAPLLIHLAEKDARVNASALPWVVALRNAGKQVRAINYHGVNHAFHNDTSAERYDRKAAERAWAATLDFFASHLGRG